MPTRAKKGLKSEPDTRTRILEAANGLVLKRGGAEISMADIASAADLSRQAVYLHFADRGALFVALVRYVDEKRGLEQEVDRIRSAPSGIAAIRAMSSLQARTNAEIWPLARAADAVRRTDPAMERAWQDRLRDRYAACREIVKRLSVEGSLRGGLSEENASDMLWAITSLRMWEDLVLQRKWKPSQYEKHVTDLLLRTLTKQPD